VNSPPCAECRAIYHDLAAGYRVARENSAPGTAPRQLAEWVHQLDYDECARLRGTSSLWRAWRRLQAHRLQTGHSLSWLLSGRMSTPN